MRHQFRQVSISLVLVAAATALGFLAAALGMTGIVMLYLLAVTAVSYFLGFAATIISAVASFLAINYFFIEPRYTFEVANGESWAALLGFLAVSLVVASLVKRLRNQTSRAEQARQYAEFARELAERLAGLHGEDEVLEAGCRLIHQANGLPTGIAVPDAAGSRFVLTHQHPKNSVELDQHAAKWCCQNARMIGPGSGNWPEVGVWLLPFERLPGNFPILVAVKGNAAVGETEITFLRGLLDQVGTAYQRVRNERRAAAAELLAQKEAMQNALLASISHDMRTPLTAILGAATTLLAQRAVLDDDAQAQLLQSISAEAQHLANTTENILAWSRLQILDERAMVLDWQSAEEIIGAVLQRYRMRKLPHELRTDVPPGIPLIRADAILLAQALGNLIDNALEAHRGTEPIWISVEADNGQVALCVKDRGEGFPTDFQVEHIRKFRRPHVHGRGMGLGLAIVQTIAHLHGAALQIGRRGGGTRLALVFPAKPEESELG